MGGDAWSYFVPFESSVESALATLRQRVFESGQYRGSDKKPASIEEVMESMDPDGTASILDIMRISDSPGIFSASPLSETELVSFFGTAQPTHDMVEACNALYDDIGRGQAVYLVVYKDDEPDEYFFAGYSLD